MPGIYTKGFPTASPGTRRKETPEPNGCALSSTWNYCLRSVVFWTGELDPHCPSPQPRGDPTLTEQGPGLGRSRGQDWRLVGLGERAERTETPTLPRPVESSWQSLSCEGRGLLPKVSSTVSAPWPHRPDSQRVPSHSGQSAKFPQGPLLEEEGVSIKSPGCQPHPLVRGHAAGQPECRKDGGLASLMWVGKPTSFLFPLLHQQLVHLASSRWRRQGSHQSPRKDTASFRPAMLPDVDDPSSTSWEITVSRDRQAEA